MVKERLVWIWPLLCIESSPWKVWWEWKIEKGERQLDKLYPQAELQSAQPSLGTPSSPLDDVPLHPYCPPWSHHGCLPLWVNTERKESNEIRLLNWPAFWQNLFLPNRGSHWWDTLGDKLDGHRTEHLLLNEEHCSSGYTDLYARIFLTPSHLKTPSLFMSCQKWSLSHS